MDIHDLTGRELIFIKRFEQHGIKRKKFINAPVAAAATAEKQES